MDRMRVRWRTRCNHTFFIGKPEGTPSVGEPMPARADDTEIHLEDVETIKAECINFTVGVEASVGLLLTR